MYIQAVDGGQIHKEGASKEEEKKKWIRVMENYVCIYILWVEDEPRKKEKVWRIKSSKVAKVDDGRKKSGRGGRWYLYSHNPARKSHPSLHLLLPASCFSSFLQSLLKFCQSKP